MAATLAAAQAQEGYPMKEEVFQFLARASSTSEVLTLNVTNFIILLILKAIIFGFGLFSVGGTGRSMEDGVSVAQSDVTGGVCFLSFMSGAEEKFDCVKRSACEDPKTGNEYLTAAKMWYKMHSLIKAIPFHEKYYTVLEGLEEALSHSVEGGDCSVYQW